MHGYNFMLYSAAKAGLISEPVSATRTICFIFFSFPLPLIRLSRIILHGFPNYVNGFHKLPYFHKKERILFICVLVFLFSCLCLFCLSIGFASSLRALFGSLLLPQLCQLSGHPLHLRAAFLLQLIRIRHNAPLQINILRRCAEYRIA